MIRGTYGFSNLISAPFRGTPVKSHSLLNCPVVGANRLLERCESIGSVSIHDVDILELKALEGCLKTLNDVLARLAVIVY